MALGQLSVPMGPTETQSDRRMTRRAQRHREASGTVPSSRASNFSMRATPKGLAAKSCARIFLQVRWNGGRVWIWGKSDSRELSAMSMWLRNGHAGVSAYEDVHCNRAQKAVPMLDRHANESHFELPCSCWQLTSAAHSQALQLAAYFLPGEALQHPSLPSPSRDGGAASPHLPQVHSRASALENRCVAEHPKYPSASHMAEHQPHARGGCALQLQDLALAECQGGSRAVSTP